MKVIKRKATRRDLPRVVRRKPQGLKKIMEKGGESGATDFGGATCGEMESVREPATLFKRRSDSGSIRGRRSKRRGQTLVTRRREGS